MSEVCVLPATQQSSRSDCYACRIESLDQRAGLSAERLQAYCYANHHASNLATQGIDSESIRQALRHIEPFRDELGEFYGVTLAPDFIRLDYIGQSDGIGLSNYGKQLDYSRLVHGIRVGLRAQRLAVQLGLPAKDAMASGLCHDIGHQPGSHPGERAVACFLNGFTHERYNLHVITRSNIAYELERAGASAVSTVRILDNEIHKSRLSPEERALRFLVAEVADRNEYMLMDSELSNLSPEQVRRILEAVHRFEQSLVYKNGEICCSDLSAAQEQLACRRMLFRAAPVHPCGVLCGNILVDGILDAFEAGKYRRADGAFDLISFGRMTNRQLFDTFAPQAKQLLTHKQADLVFQPVCVIALNQFNQVGLEVLHSGAKHDLEMAADKARRGLQRELARALRVEGDAVVIGITPDYSKRMVLNLLAEPSQAPIPAVVQELVPASEREVVVWVRKDELREASKAAHLALMYLSPMLRDFERSNLDSSLRAMRLRGEMSATE